MKIGNVQVMWVWTGWRATLGYWVGRRWHFAPILFTRLVNGWFFDLGPLRLWGGAR